MGPQPTPFNLAVFVGWFLAVPVLFRALGGRRAVPIALLGNCLFLVSLTFETPLPFHVPITKDTVTGLAVVLGILLFDRRILSGARPRWFDVPMIAYVLAPMAGLLSSGRVGLSDSVDEVLFRVFCWLVPYAAGRLYFGRDDGPRAVGAAIVVATLCLVPVCVFETTMGPRWYLSTLVYGTQYHPGMAERLGGWRPEGFFNNGIALATWMALGSTVAFWMWLGRGWRLGWLPAWLPPMVLVTTTILCRGVYGYISLGIGLAGSLLTQKLRTRWVIGALALAAPLYIALRVSGHWDARALVAMGERVVPGRGSTVKVRLESEDRVLSLVRGRNLVLGFGNHLWHMSAVGVNFTAHWPDGWWLRVIWEGGVLGLVIHLAALHLVPAGLALSRPPTRPSAAEAGTTAWGLALFSVVSMVDSLHNASPFMPIGLAAGSIVGWSVNRRPPAHPRRHRAPAQPEPGDVEVGPDVFRPHRPAPAPGSGTDTFRDPATERGLEDGPRFARRRDVPGGTDLALNLARLLLVLALLAAPDVLDSVLRPARNGPESPPTLKAARRPLAPEPAPSDPAALDARFRP